MELKLNELFIVTFNSLQLRQRILLSAFPKAMRDPYPLARLSGIVAMANTDRFYTLRDVASKVLPSLCMLTVDPEKDVRDEAFKTIKIFIQKLEKVSENPELALEMEKEVSSCTLDAKNETTWTSWAMNSLSSKMSGYKNKSQQPSVALNTQPLGPPQSLTTSSTTSTSSSNSVTEKSPEKPSKSKEETSSASKPNKPETNSSFKEPIKEEAPNSWGFDDNEWKDLDEDGDFIEPLEPIEPVNTKTTTQVNSSITKPSSQTQANDWSVWTNSFDEFKMTNNENNENLNPKAQNKPKTALKAENSSIKNASTKLAEQPKLPSTSSYNWNQSTSNSSNKEEDLFSSLIKDVSISNKVILLSYSQFKFETN